MLHVPNGANNLAAMQSSSTLRPSNSFQGTVVTPAVGSKGAWSELLAATSNDSFGMLLMVNNSFTAAAGRNFVLDIGIGGAGSERVIVPNLICGMANPYPSAIYHYFPLFIPAGSRVAVRSQANIANAFRCQISLYQQPARPDAVKAGSFCEIVGGTALPGGGTSITLGTTGKSAWQLLGTTTRDLWWWQTGMQVPEADTNVGGNAILLDLAVGNGTAFVPIMQDVIYATGTSEVVQSIPFLYGNERPVPAGSNIYVRGWASGTPEAAYLVAAYGIGG